MGRGHRISQRVYALSPLKYSTGGSKVRETLRSLARALFKTGCAFPISGGTRYTCHLVSKKGLWIRQRTAANQLAMGSKQLAMKDIREEENVQSMGGTESESSPSQPSMSVSAAASNVPRRGR